MPRARVRVLALGGAACLGLVVVALSAAANDDRVPILHEDLEPPPEQAARTARRLADGVPVLGPEPSALQNPTAIAANDKLLPEPTAAADPIDDEPVFGNDDFGATRQSEARPDYATGSDSTLHYVGVFNPSVVPFKRMSAMDSVRDDFTLFAGSPALADLPVGGAPRGDRDLFWGSIVVELSPGVDVPIPSVAPDMRVLSYEAEPSIQLRFSKDGADNYYVRSDEAGASGRHRLVFLVDADPGHFAPTVPARLRVRDVPGDRVAPLPPRVRATALQALKHLELHRDLRAQDALDTLTHYFRSFAPGEPPPPSGDIYWDLFSTQTGVCRHRAFAFMITANALGLPTRFLANEAHAWVEVWLPEAGWMRIDLGGAADTLEVAGARDKSMYRPRGDDPFAKPEAYAENYTRLEGDIEGLTDEQIAERQEAYEEDGATSGGDGAGDGDELAEGVEEPGGGTPIAPGQSLPEVPAEAIAGKVPTRVDVSSASAVGFRGETIEIEGTLRAGGAGLGGQRVDLFLAPAGAGGDGARLVGHAVTDDDGTFAARVALPADLPLADHEVFAATPGDARYQPSVSD